MPYSFVDNQFFKISNVHDGLRTMLSGIPGGFYTANHILKVAGTHSNRTAEEIYESNLPQGDKETELVDLVVLRLIAELDVITNDRELISGIIMLMNSGIILSHWKKFVLSTDFTSKKYEVIHIKQVQFETRKKDVYVSGDMEAEARKFNKLNERLNSIVQGYYSNLQPMVDKKFGELFTLLSINCNLSMEEYDELIKYRYQLLERTKNENYALRLLRNISSRCTEVDIWDEFLKIKREISAELMPNKSTLYSLFEIDKELQRKMQQQFIAHFRFGFHDDLNSIINRLNLEV